MADKPRSNLRIIIPLAILAILGGIVFRACSPSLLHGRMLDTVVVTDDSGKQTLWILMDDSWNYTSGGSRTRSGGSPGCFSCKTWTYLYDPMAGKVLKRTKTALAGPVLKGTITPHGDRVWLVLPAYGGREPVIEQFDEKTGERVLDTTGFIARFPELAAGLVDVTKSGSKLTFSTKDGRTGLTYSVHDDKMYPSASAVPAMAAGRSAIMKDDATSSPRKTLVVPSPTDTWDTASYPVGRDRVFLEGIIYEQGPDHVAIIHLDRVGPKADRMLTLVDLNANRELWTIKQDQLFPQMKIDEQSSSFKDLFFTKDKIHVDRYGNVIVLTYQYVGVMAFDYATGKKLWTVYP